ncbi:fimbrial protein [Xenorhabdus szentirmaii]|uniref:Fimbrial protein n=1 Tax=Xenorhabdus szentirmaii DSM 16338 TaxID=1427518 RepID=W1IVA8_9GAMM|nr:fimbrial protein [Xenorhabdus szentirmaii]PHM34922.1 fimbrial adhesin protein precursor [Xenorhabdus szentirmaii DSM 16338]CDL82384.1 putative Fimbrial protein [Xenorhabdus szentirmaii DSM 16338]
MTTNEVKKSGIIKLLLGTSLLILSSKGYAGPAHDCWVEIPLNSNNANFLPIQYTISVGEDFEINPDLPVNSVLLTQSLPATSPTGQFMCDSQLGLYRYEGIGTPTNSIYPIPNIPGLGYRIKKTTDKSGHDIEDGWFPYTRNQVYNENTFETLTQYKGLLFNHQVIYHLQLVKIGDILRGGQLTGEIAKGIALEKNNFQYFSLKIAGSINVKLVYPSCTLKTPSINVPLGDVSKSDFQGIGTETQPKQFKIDLECSSGSPEKTSHPKMTLEDVSFPSNQSDILTLSKNATAKGVGIRIYHKNNPVNYQPNNNIRLGELSKGHHSIPFQANYIQSESTVTPGSVHASAVFKLAYD